jgi:hypothetical protein
MFKGYLFSLITLLISTLNSFSQFTKYPNQYLPYHFESYQKIESTTFDQKAKLHTSLKPYFADDSIISKSLGVDQSFKALENKKSWIKRKLFDEHLIEINHKEYSFYADFLPDFQIGQSNATENKTWLNTRGYQFGGTIGDKFSFYTSGYENQGVFPEYLSDYVLATTIIPGQSYNRTNLGTSKDWSYATTLLSYTPINFLNLTLGQDKIFIGDGYRSMLLSDFGSNYPFLKATVNLGNVQYTAIWAGFQEPKATKLSYDTGNRKKGGVFHYLDWNVNSRLSFGFFDAIIWAATDDLGNRRGFDATYINPFIFLRPLEASNGSPDNALIGFTSKYKLLNDLTLYGQFVLDEFEAKNFFNASGSARNKWGIQIGARGGNIFNLKNLHYLIEYNTAKPYTYSSRNLIGSYTNYSEPLAHPYGANFKEFVSILTYQIKRLNIYTKLNLAEYGYDIGTANYGKDPFKPYNTAALSTGNKVGQGLNTSLFYLDNRISYLINPKTNLRLELGLVARKENNNSFNNKTNWVTFGLRSSFRNIYYDF